MKRSIQICSLAASILWLAAISLQAQEYHFKEGFATNAAPAGWTIDNVSWSSSASNAHNGDTAMKYCAKMQPIQSILTTLAVNTADSLSFWIKVKKVDANPHLSVERSVNMGATWDTLLFDPHDPLDDSTFQFIKVAVHDTSSQIMIRFNVTGTGDDRNAGLMTIDDIWLSKLPAAKDDATLSMISVDGENLTDFSLSTYSYNVLLFWGTSEIPVVEAVTNSEKANADIQQATNLYGAEAERTATIVVTAEDGTTQLTYQVLFTVSEYLFFTGFPQTGEEVVPFEGWTTDYTWVQDGQNHGELWGIGAFKFVRGQPDKPGFLKSPKYAKCGTMSFWLLVEAPDGSEQLKIEYQKGFSLPVTLANYTSADLSDSWKYFELEINEADSIEITFTPSMTPEGSVRIWMDDLKMTGYGSVSVNNLNGRFRVRTFPNPVDGFLTLDLNGKDFNFIEIFDITGQKIMQQVISKDVSTVCMKDLSKGLYIISLTGRSETYTTRIIKK